MLIPVRWIPNSPGRVAQVLNKWAEKSAMQSSIETILDGACPRDRYEFGFADLTGLLAGEYRLFSFGVSILRPLDARIIDGIAGGPTPEYHRHYRAVNRELAEAVERVRDGLDGLGIRALGVKPTVEDGELDDGYYKTLRLNFSHKMAATRAGLGWIGKTDLFISKKHGPRVRLASVLLDAPVTSRAAPIDVSLCGTCEVCVTACPAGAATGALWDIQAGTDREAGVGEPRQRLLFQELEEPAKHDWFYPNHRRRVSEANRRTSAGWSTCGSITCRSWPGSQAGTILSTGLRLRAEYIHDAWCADAGDPGRLQKGEKAAGRRQAPGADLPQEYRPPQPVRRPTAAPVQRTTADRCHRRLVLEYLNSQWGNIHAVHL